MPVPSTIRVGYDAEQYTNNIGRCTDGRQFMAFVVSTLPLQWLPEPAMMIASLALGANWERRKRWYAVLHTFDARGKHLRTEAVFTGTSADGENDVVAAARAKRDEMMRALGPIDFGDVEVALFSVRTAGVRFGLFDTSDSHGERVVLLPNDFVFSPPWDGDYST
jgi:hypothetical protein